MSDLAHSGDVSPGQAAYLDQAVEMVQDSLDSQPLTQCERTLLNVARIVDAYPDKVPWVERAVLRMAAYMLWIEDTDAR